MSADTPNIDIRPDHWKIVRDILQKHVPEYEVWAFGSRAKKTAKKHSDLDPESVTPPPRCSSQVVDVAKHLLRVDADSASPCG